MSPATIASQLLQRLRDRWIVRDITLRARSVRRVFLFESDWAGIAFYLRPLVHRLATSSENLIVVVTQESEVEPIRKIMKDGTSSEVGGVHVISYDRCDQLRIHFSCLVSCQPYSRVAPALQDIPKIQLLHGIADKRGELFGPRGLSDFSHLFSPAPVVTELARDRLLSEGYADHAALEIVKTGCPKTDDLFDGTYRRKSILEELGLPENRPLVLYAPTWEKEASLEQYGEQIVSSMSELGISLLVKPHPLTIASQTDPFLIENAHGGKNWKAILAEWEDRFPNTRWVRDPYANPYLVAADLLLSEGSGIAFEYVLLDKPIVFVETPLVSERHGTDNLHHRLRACGAVSPTIEDLSVLVKRHLDHPDLQAAERRRLMNELAYNPGTATDAASSIISHLLSS